MASIWSLRLARLALALLFFSLASAAIPPGQIMAQAYTATDWSSWGATAWKYYTPGVGVNSATGLHKATLGWDCFTDWDLGSYIYSIIYARKLGLISESGSWQFEDRINKILTFLQNRPLGTNNSPYGAYQYDAMNPYKTCSDSYPPGQAADTGRLLAALYALKVFRPTYVSQVDGIITRSKSTLDIWATQVGSAGYYDYLIAEGFAAMVWILAMTVLILGASVGKGKCKIRL